MRRVGPAKTGLAGLIEPLRYAKRTSLIEHELDALTPLTLAEVKARLVAGIEAFPDYWGDDAEEVAGRVAEVRAVSTIAEVHSVLGLDDFSVKPGVPNAFGLVSGGANAPGPGKQRGPGG